MLDINQSQSADTSVASIERWLEHPVPEPYRSFLIEASNPITLVDGGRIYGSAEIIERNETFESQVYCPGHLAIGEDAVGNALMLSVENGSVARVTISAMTVDYFEPVAPSFEHWLDHDFALGSQ